MSDTYELDPDFAENSKKTTHSDQKIGFNKPVSNTIVNKDLGKESVVMSFYEQNKMLIIIAVAVLIVLIICILYWYFTKPVETTQNPASPPKKQYNPDNIQPSNLEHVLMNKELKTETKPIVENNSNINQNTPQNNKNQTITHEDLVANTDDAEIDKYINPEEHSYKKDETLDTSLNNSPKKKQKQTPDITIENDEDNSSEEENSSDKNSNNLSQDLDDLDELSVS